MSARRRKPRTHGARRGPPLSADSLAEPGLRARKERMTFRLSSALARTLRGIPNQTAFVERALREALHQLCPLCRGTGQVPADPLHVSDLRPLDLGRLDRATAEQLRSLVRLGRQVRATSLELHREGADARMGMDCGLRFRLARDRSLLLSGKITRAGTEVTASGEALSN